MVNVDDDDDDMVCEGTLMYPFGVKAHYYYKLSCFSKALLPLLHA